MLELNVNKSKVLPEVPIVRRGVVTAAADGQFSLILDQAVGETQEKTVAADNPSDTEQLLPPSVAVPRRKLINEMGALFDKAAGAALAEHKAPVKSVKDKNDAVQAETKTEEIEETPNSAPVNLIQTQAEQIIDKNPRAVNLSLSEIEFSAAPAPRVPLTAPVPFADIYAELLHNVQMKKDGQILKFKFALEPENLGKIDVYIFADKKNLHIAFAAAEDIRKMLAADAPELRDILERYGFSPANMDFSSLAGQRHQELESRFLSQESAANDFGVLKTLSQNDIIEEVRFLMGNVMVNYLA